MKFLINNKAGIRVKVPRLFYSLESVSSDLPFLFTSKISIMLTENKSTNDNENLNPKEFLTTLEKLKTIPDYENLGFTLKSLCNIAQTALLAETECKSLTLCHKPLDLYNIFTLIKTLIPKDELELLDKLNA